MSTPSTVEKGGAGFEGITLLLCENPLPPMAEAQEAARAVLPRSNHYTEPYSEPLRQLLSERHDVPVEHIHINAGSELILRQLFDRLGHQAHLLTPTYPLFPEIAETYTETELHPENGFQYDLRDLEIPAATSITVVVNPNNPTGRSFDLDPLPELLTNHPETTFLVDEAFVDFIDDSAVALVPEYDNLIVTRTLSKAHSLAGFRIGYAVLPIPLAEDLNANNDAYPLARPSQAAAIATLQNEAKLRERMDTLRTWTDELAADLRDLGVRTFPTETYFFLADFSPHDAADIAERLREDEIFIKPLGNSRLGPGYMRVTTARPDDNERVVAAIDRIL